MILYVRKPEGWEAVSAHVTRIPQSAAAPEKLERALLLQVLYSARSEPMLMEHPKCNLLFRWVRWPEYGRRDLDATVFTKNRQGLLAGDISDAFFAAVLRLTKRVVA